MPKNHDPTAEPGSWTQKPFITAVNAHKMPNTKGIHSAASMAKLTAQRKIKIQALAEKEAERARKSRLESLLAQKLVVSALRLLRTCSHSTGPYSYRNNRLVLPVVASDPS